PAAVLAGSPGGKPPSRAVSEDHASKPRGPVADAGRSARRVPGARRISTLAGRSTERNQGGQPAAPRLFQRRGDMPRFGRAIGELARWWPSTPGRQPLYQGNQLTSGVVSPTGWTIRCRGIDRGDPGDQRLGIAYR